MCFCMLPGDSFVLALNIISAVLYSKRSINFMACNCENNIFLCSNYPTLLTIQMALSPHGGAITGQVGYCGLMVANGPGY